MKLLSSNTTLVGRVVFRLLLVVSLWDGPVFWGHSHRVATLETSGLASHISAHHASENDASQLGWHWHFSIPDADGSESRRGESSRRMPQTVVSFAETGMACASLAGIDAGGGSSRDVVPGLDSLHDLAERTRANVPNVRPVSRANLSCRLRC